MVGNHYRSGHARSFALEGNFFLNVSTRGFFLFVWHSLIYVWVGRTIMLKFIVVWKLGCGARSSSPLSQIQRSGAFREIRARNLKY